jgi:hypothetical protein
MTREIFPTVLARGAARQKAWRRIVGLTSWLERGSFLLLPSFPNSGVIGADPTARNMIDIAAGISSSLYDSNHPKLSLQ